LETVQDRDNTIKSNRKSCVCGLSN